MTKPQLSHDLLFTKGEKVTYRNNGADVPATVFHQVRDPDSDAYGMVTIHTDDGVVVFQHPEKLTRTASRRHAPIHDWWDTLDSADQDLLRRGDLLPLRLTAGINALSIMTSTPAGPFDIPAGAGDVGMFEIPEDIHVFLDQLDDEESE